ncbi:MAG TPA: RcnB family protein [Rhodanobacter sp.]
MKLAHRLLIAMALLGSGSVALAQDHGQDHSHDHSQGHDRGHDNQGQHGNNRGHDDHRGNGNIHRGHDYRPAPRYYGHGGYGRPGYGRGHWERGHRYYGPTYVVRNYGYYRLRPPPYGYRWVRADNDFLLVAITTGIILDIATH